MITNTSTEKSYSQIMRAAVDKCPSKLRRLGYEPFTRALDAEDEREFLATAIRDARRNGRDVIVRKVYAGVVEAWQR